MNDRVFLPILMLGILAFAGCGQPAGDPKPEPIHIAPAPLDPVHEEDGSPPVSVVPPPPAAARADKEAADSTSEASHAPPVELVTLTIDEYKKELEGLKGKSVVVDAWATWCVPCRAKFPRFVELANRLGNAEVVFLSLNFDAEEEVEAARNFLADSNARMKNVRLVEELAAAQDELGFEGLPRYFLYDPEGNLVVNSASLTDIESKLDKGNH